MYKAQFTKQYGNVNVNGNEIAKKAYSIYL